MTVSVDSCLLWRKSSYSAGNGGCVEVAWSGDVLVRDSKQIGGPPLRLPVGQWRRFLAAVG